LAATIEFMKIAFCITCKDRLDHIRRTLPRNLADNPSALFVLLDYNSPDQLASYLQTEHAAAIDAGQLVVYHFPAQWPFRMAHAKNMAHRLGMREGADVLVNLDADNFTGPNFAAYVAAQFVEHGPNAFLWAKMIQHGPERTARGISGRIVVTAEAFIKAGGYHEVFKTWSPDDKDFNARLRRLGYTPIEIDRQYLNCITHTEKMRFKEYREAGEPGAYDNFEQVNDSDNTVVNFGAIGLGTVFKNFGPVPVTIEPIPTRVFGIGMHKTATTSLHTALQYLGIDSAHWKSAHWAKAIWEEMNAWGRSLTLERYYAVSDLPLALLYQQLDAAYPGSKFILTTRTEHRWIASVKNHWSHEHNKFRADWTHDPFTHRVHKLLYGQKGFDAEIFAARFRRHNSEVAEYFKDRPDDLLVMDMDQQGAGWPALCAFLKRPIPDVAYPQAFTTPQPKEK
jgi:Sulfotransferase domain